MILINMINIRVDSSLDGLAIRSYAGQVEDRVVQVASDKAPDLKVLIRMGKQVREDVVELVLADDSELELSANRAEDKRFGLFLLCIKR